MKLIVDNQYTYVETKECRDIIDSVTSFKVPGYWYSPQYKKGFWDGKSHLLSRGKFPTGLLLRVCRALQLAGETAEIVDMRQKPKLELREPSLKGIQLRDYQLEAIAACLDWERGIIALPPAAGKTNVALGVIATMNFPKTLVLVDRKDLLYQLYNVFSSQYKDVGMVGDGKHIGGRITIATWQSLSSGVGDYDGDVLIVDECHKAASEKYYKVAMTSKAYYRFGLSGSANLREDKRDMFLVGLTGEEIYSSTAKELEDYLSIPLIVIYTIVKPNVPNDSPYSEVYRLGITRNEHRNELIKNICEKYHAAGKTVLVLVKEIAHGHKLAEMLACPFLSGNSSTDERLAEASKLRDGSRKLLVASTIFNEGLDFPDLDVVVIASGGESTIQTLQRVGRAMRKKQFGGIVIDFDDQTHKYLKAHSAARISDYEKRVGCSISRRGVNDNEYENV